MTEKQLISQIKKLKCIKPRKEWVVLSKQTILREEPVEARSSVFINELFTGIRFIFSHKYAFSPIVAVLVLVGTFGFAQNSIPGDLLFPVKKITEKTQNMFILSQEGLSKRNLEIVNKRLDELTKVAQSNSAKNLSPAINEYQASVSEVARAITKKGVEKSPEKVKDILEEVKQIEERTSGIKSLGVEIGENVELDTLLVQMISGQLEELNKKALTMEEMQIMVSVKEDLESGSYAEACDKLALLNQNTK
jgi:hypothetical protein